MNWQWDSRVFQMSPENHGFLYVSTRNRRLWELCLKCTIQMLCLVGWFIDKRRVTDIIIPINFWSYRLRLNIHQLIPEFTVIHHLSNTYRKLHNTTAGEQYWQYSVILVGPNESSDVVKGSSRDTHTTAWVIKKLSCELKLVWGGAKTRQVVSNYSY